MPQPDRLIEDVEPRRFTGWLLRRAFVVARQEARACVDDDTVLREVPALTALAAAESMSQRDLAALLNLSATVTGRLIELLLARGWAQRVRDEHDRRSYAVSITPLGLDKLVELRASLDEAEKRVTRGLSGTERAILRAALRALLADDPPTTRIPGLDERVGYLVSRAHTVVMGRAQRALAGVAITPRDFGMLATLGRNQPCSQQRLADELRVSAPAVFALVDELEQRGLVARQRNQTDRRAYDVTLTPTGEDALVRARRLALEMQAQIAASLGPEQDQQLRELLERIAPGADPVAVSSAP